MRKPFTLLTSVALALSLVSCGNGSASTNVEKSEDLASVSPSQPVIPGQGNISTSGVDFTTLTPADLKLTTDMDYEFLSSKGARGTVTFIDATDPKAAEVEAFLKKAVGYHREYLKVRVDNSEGTDVVSIPEVTVEGADELEYPFLSMNSTLSEAIPVMNSDYSYTTADGMKELTEAEYEQLTEEGYALDEKQRFNIKPGGKGTLLFAMEIDEGALPKDIATVSVPVHGIFEEVMAKNGLVSEYKEWKAFQEAGKEWKAYSTAAPEG
ncbi:hypothetical protein [Arthrobacter sp. JUb115]|uniref:hypothetical protein n=1 Tax=Arthrobacter sp. JUb115 TaxID=2485108 RepID=UPI00105B731C|nr:hypothetical protein [Arthrobacter sp. JUb115]TDU27116.1 hypothetical protein EDF61_104192 [Arthrobacter sp. JUb115]